MKFGSKKGLFGASAVALALGLAGPVAYAQDTQDDEAAQNQQTEDDQADESEEEIVVTGSRIRRDAFTSASPVELITSESATLEGLGDTQDILNNSTAVSGSGQLNNFFGGFVVQGGPGVNTVSLRGLGSIRTLVMVNGRRLNPAGTRGQVGAVDLNVIPASLIERVEVLLDGASSIYGSDAVAGVVNVITRDNLDGGVISAGGTQSFEGGGEEFSVNGAWGHQFDRGNLTASFEYFERQDLNLDDRDYLLCGRDNVTDPDTGRSRDFLDDNGDPQCTNGTLTGVVNRRTGGAARFIQTPGSLADTFTGSLPGLTRVAMSFAQVYAAERNRAIAAGTNLLIPANADALYALATERYRQNLLLTPSDFQPESDAISSVERFTAFMTGNWDVGDNHEIYGEAMYNHRESNQDGRAQLFFNAFNGTRLHPQNPFAGQIADSTVTRRSNSWQSIDFYRGVFGIRGDLPFGGWEYDVYGQVGKSEGEYVSENVETDRLLWALGLNATGTTFVGACPVGVADDGCTAFNPWDPTYVSGGGSAALDYIVQEQVGNTTYEQTLFQAVANGDLFDLPAGTVSMAVGAEWREESIDDIPAANIQSGNVFGFTSAGRTKGTDTVSEVFGEISIPILAGQPYFEELTFDGSYRFTDYESYGQNDTYKIGLNWQVVPSVRLRATLGTSYRAPALFELFLANQTGFQSQVNIDPCIEWGLSTNNVLRTRCAADGIPDDYTAAGTSSATVFTGGGAGILDAETSEAQTFGIIWRPSFADLNIAIDYYEISVLDQVAQFGAANILTACYTGQGDDFCTLFTRNSGTDTPPFQVNTVNNSYVNLNQQLTRGIDFNLRYEHEFPFADMTIDTRASWTLEDEVTLFGGGIVDFNSDLGEPAWTAGTSVRFDRDDWTFFWDVDVIGPQSDVTPEGGEVFTFRQGAIAGIPGVAPAVAANPVFFDWRAETRFYHDASIRYRSDNWSLTAGVQNLFDEIPPIISGGGTNSGRLGNVTLTSQSDILGRRAFVELSRSW